MSKVAKTVEDKIEPFNELACNCGAILEYIGSSQDAKHVYKTYKCPKCGNMKVIKE